MSIFDQFSKVTKDFGNKAQEMTKDIKGKLEEQQAISRLNAQVNEAKNQMKNTYIVSFSDCHVCIFHLIFCSGK